MFAIIVSVGLGVGLAMASGLRVFIPLLFASIACKMGLLELKDGFQWICSRPALAMFLTATALEVGTFYIPVLDHALDVAATFAAPATGVFVSIMVLPSDMAPAATWAVGIIGGGSALTT